MQRAQKLAALKSVLSGNAQPLRTLRNRRRARSYDDMSDEELQVIIDAENRRMTPKERAQYPDWYFTRDWDSLTDEQLNWIINHAEGHEQAPPQ